MNHTFFCTPNAIQALRRKIQSPSNLIRIGVSGSAACAGYRYVLSFDQVEKTPRDLTFTFEDLLIVIDPRSMSILSGTTLDFHKSLKEEKFVFTNPQVEKTCGCGQSFSLGDKS